MKKSWIRNQSRKTAKKNRRYSVLRASFLEQNPRCQCEPTPGNRCVNASSQVHHRKGRGKYLNAVATWMAVCADCHERIHQNPKWAKDLGYSLNRASNNPIQPL